jgi:ribosomal-protein-alanine N-acetyltransferase
MKRTIRPLHKRDLDALLSIERASFSLPWTREMMAAEFEKSYAFFTGLFQEGRLAGFCLSWVLFDEGHIADFAVHPDFRRQGAGGVLLDAALEKMRQRGALTVWLEVRVSNHPARALYRSRGFTEAGQRKNYYTDTGEDALVMQLTLEKGRKNDIIQHAKEE